MKLLNKSIGLLFLISLSVFLSPISVRAGKLSSANLIVLNKNLTFIYFNLIEEDEVDDDAVVNEETPSETQTAAEVNPCTNLNNT